MHSLISIVISDNKMSWKLLKKIRNKCWHISRISIGDVRLLQAEILKKTETNAISRDDYNILHSITVNMIDQANSWNYISPSENQAIQCYQSTETPSLLSYSWRVVRKSTKSQIY
jgi:hypothetical protein